MEWLPLYQFTLSENWQFSPITLNTYFKIIHTISNHSSQNSIALIALINDEITPIEIFEPKRILPRLEAEIIKFTRIPGWKYKLAIKQIKLPNQSLLNWKIDVETIFIEENIPIPVPTPIVDLRLQSKFNSPKKTLLIAAV